jgi:hypothetical protein
MSFRPVALEASEFQFLNTGRGRPENSQPGTAALRNAGVLACELLHRPGALLIIEMRSCPPKQGIVPVANPSYKLSIGKKDFVT